MGRDGTWWDVVGRDEMWWGRDKTWWDVVGRGGIYISRLLLNFVDEIP